LRALPEVFDLGARPWVNVSGAPAGSVAAAVRLCPTGALRYESVGEIPDEVPDQPTSIEVRPNGPLYIRGRVRVTGRGGEVLAEETRVALCRCGASQNKPFCDNSHRLMGFRG
jgi:Iron-binding zinc finger CDGSH type/Divergent 4Fe-4S mono-cluster